MSERSRLGGNRPPRERSEVVLYVSMVANFVLVLCLAVIVSRLHPIDRITNWLYPENKSYENDPASFITSSFFAVYEPPEEVKVVLFGDSNIWNINWNELLSRSDIAGRGTRGDTVAGMLARFDQIERLKPRVVFVHIGINDIIRGHSLETCLANYIEFVRRLEVSGITPVISAALPVATSYENGQEINRKVSAWNDMLKAYAGQNGFTFLDVDPELIDDGALRADLAHDGLHLMGPGYAIWRKGIVRALSLADQSISETQTHALRR